MLNGVEFQTYQAGQQYTIPTATDADEGENARVVYQLSPRADQYFTIDRDSSVLTTRAECGVECIKTEDCSLGTVSHPLTHAPPTVLYTSQQVPVPFRHTTLRFAKQLYAIVYHTSNNIFLKSFISASSRQTQTEIGSLSWKAYRPMLPPKK